MEIFTFNMKEHLPIIREAFDNKTLQMFDPETKSRCYYSGPCALGVCMNEAQRKYYDSEEITASGAQSLFDTEYFKAQDDDVEYHLCKLQGMHDNAAVYLYLSKKYESQDVEYAKSLAENHNKRIQDFGSYLKELEEIYLKEES